MPEGLTRPEQMQIKAQCAEIQPPVKQIQTQHYSGGGIKSIYFCYIA
jgi:hypothetical protein